MDVLGSLIIDIILSGIGSLYLYVRYRNKRIRMKVKNDKYAGSYGAAGGVLMLNLVAGTGAIVLFGFLMFILVAWIYSLITG